MIRHFFFRKSLNSAIVPKVDPRERVYAIGDIHGRYDLLKGLLTKINEDALKFHDMRHARLVFLGDYVDRGDDAARVLNILEYLASGDRHRIDFLLGNHEQALLDFLEDPARSEPWLGIGGAQTLASYGIAAPASNSDIDALVEIRSQLRHALGSKVDFLKSLVPYALSGDVLFTHAGVNPRAKEVLEDQDAMIWGHPDFRTDEPLFQRRVVHGHYDALEVYRSKGRICVDTGAYYSGKLTAVRLDEGETILEVSALDLDLELD